MKEVANGEIHVIIGMFLSVLNSKLQTYASTETTVRAYTHS